MIKANVYVSLKQSVLDPQGKVITDTIHHLGFLSAKETRCSKFFEIIFDGNDKEKVSQEMTKICQNLLANPNTESFRFDLVDYNEKNQV